MGVALAGLVNTLGWALELNDLRIDEQHFLKVLDALSIENGTEE